MTEDTFETRSFKLTLGDYAAYAINGYYLQIFRGKRGLIHLAFAVASAFLFNSGAVLRGNMAVSLPGALIYPAFILVLAPLLALIKVVWAAKAIPGMRVARIVTFSPDAVMINRDGLDVTLAWRTFRTLLETRRAIYLMRATEGQIILKSAFASSDMARQAVIRARHHIKYANDQKARVFYETGVANEPSESETVTPPYRLNFRLFAASFLRNRFRSIGAVFGLMPLPAGMIIFYAWLWRSDLSEGRFSPFFAASLGFALMIFVLPILLMPLSWKLSQKVPTVAGERRVAVTPDYVRGFGEGYDVQFGWKELHKVVRTRKCLFCYMQPQGVIPVPASAFASQAEADAFFDQAKAWADAARAK